jgi:chromosome partitioning protein
MDGTHLGDFSLESRSWMIRAPDGNWPARLTEENKMAVTHLGLLTTLANIQRGIKRRLGLLGGDQAGHRHLEGLARLCRLLWPFGLVSMLVTWLQPRPSQSKERAVQTIVMASRKGGCGKTTLGCHIAVEIERIQAGPVMLIDADPMAGLSHWWGARKANTPALVKVHDSLAATLASGRENGFAWAIIDTPPAAQSSVGDIIALADLVIIPVQPTPDDLRAVSVTVEMCRKAGRPFVFVINRVKPRVRLTGEAAIELSQHGVVAPTHMFDRVDYAAAKTDGRTAPELDENGLPAREVAGIWRYVSARMGVAA